MTFLLKQIFSFLKLLNSETGTNQIAAGIACGLVLGFAPAFSLQTLLVIVVLFLFRIQIGAATIAAFFFSFVAWGLDPVSNRIGIAILDMASLRPLFTALYNMPIVPLTRFYNSIVMGAGVLSLILAIPMFFVAKVLVLKYRVHVYDRFKETAFWKAFAATKIYGWYESYQQLY